MKKPVFTKKDREFNVGQKIPGTHFRQFNFYVKDPRNFKVGPKNSGIARK